MAEQCVCCTHTIQFYDFFGFKKNLKNENENFLSKNQ